MDPQQIINTLVIPTLFFVGLFGTIITVSVVRSRAKLQMREYELEALRLANEAKQLELEEQRLRLGLGQDQHYPPAR